MKSYDYKSRKGVNEITWEDFHQLCRTLAKKVSGENFEIILGIARGGLYPTTLIAGMLRKEFFPLRVTRRENDQVKFKKPVWRVDITDAVKGKKVLIVDDISDSGETLQLVAARAKEKGAAVVKTASLVTHSWASPKPDYFGLKSDELIIFPWDKQILTDGKWQLHPELEEAIKLQK